MALGEGSPPPSIYLLYTVYCIYIDNDHDAAIRESLRDTRRLFDMFFTAIHPSIDSFLAHGREYRRRRGGATREYHRRWNGHHGIDHSQQQQQHQKTPTVPDHSHQSSSFINPQYLLRHASTGMLGSALGHHPFAPP